MAGCQKCGGEIQGWICQGCGQGFRDNAAGALVFAPMEAVAWRRPGTISVVSNDEKLNALCSGDEARAAFLGQYTEALAVIPTQEAPKDQT